MQCDAMPPRANKVCALWLPLTGMSYGVLMCEYPFSSFRYLTGERFDWGPLRLDMISVDC